MRATTIDIHTHGIVLGGPEPTSAWYPRLELRGDDVNMAFKDGSSRMLPPASHQLAPRLAWMDAHGVDVQVVSPAPNTLADFLPRTEASAVAEHVNDGVAQLVHRRPDRLAGLGTVPVSAPDQGRSELTRCVSELGLLGIELSTAAVVQGLAEGWLPDLLAQAAELEALVLVHPHDRSTAERRNLTGLVQTLGLGMPAELALAGWELSRLLSGMPTRPDIILAHGGGTLPWLVARLDAMWRAGLVDDAPTDGPLTTIRQTLLTDSLVFGDSHLAALVEFLGPDRVLYGSDFPAPFAAAPGNWGSRDWAGDILAGNAHRLRAFARVLAQ